MISLDNRNVLKKKIFSLQDEISNKLSIDNDVDKFLDNTTILDEWEEILESRTPPKRRVEMKDHKASPVLRLKT